MLLITIYHHKLLLLLPLFPILPHPPFPRAALFPSNTHVFSHLLITHTPNGFRTQLIIN